MNTSNMIKMNILDVKVDRSVFFPLLEQCRKNKEFTDVQLQIGDKLFDAHRVVLSLYSPVLKAMISDQWSTAKICPISVEYVDVDIVEDLLSFLYTGSIQLTPDNVHPVCVAAHFLQIPTLLEPSVKHLCRLITSENVLTLFQFSITYQLETLRHFCLRFISKNSNVLQDSRIFKFPFNDVFKELIVGLKGFQTNMLRKNTFDCIVRWTEENLLERSNELPVLLENIPLQKLPFEFLTRTVSAHPLLKKSSSGMKTVSSALANYHTFSNLIVSGWEDEYCQKRLTVHYDSATGVWEKIPNMSRLRDSYASTIVNEKDIVVCGGFAKPYNYSLNGPKLSSVEMFEWATKSWKNLSDMPHPAGCCSVATLNGNLYVTGDIDHPDNPKTAVMCYSLKTQQWKYIKPMNYDREYCRLVEHDNYLYVFGGGTHVVEQYDPVLDEWTVKSTPDQYYESVVAATSHEDQIFVSPGGRQSKTPDAVFNHEFSSFNPETSVWTKFPETKHPSSRALISMNGRLLAILKSWLPHSVSSAITDPEWIYEFDFSTQKWEKFCQMETKLQQPKLLAGAFR